jgi:hypothetical protein
MISDSARNPTDLVGERADPLIKPAGPRATAVHAGLRDRPLAT